MFSWLGPLLSVLCTIRHICFCLPYVYSSSPSSHLFYSLYILCILSFSPSASSRYPTASPSSSSSVQINVAPRPAPDTVHPSLPHRRIAYHTRSNTSIPLVDTPPRVRVVLEAKPSSRESNRREHQFERATYPPNVGNERPLRQPPDLSEPPSEALEALHLHLVEMREAVARLLASALEAVRGWYHRLMTGRD